MQLGFRRLVPVLLGVLGARHPRDRCRCSRTERRRTTACPSSGSSCSRPTACGPDLMEKYAKDGAMPTYKALMKDGITGDNGMTPAFPPNTGVGWYTMATGTYPSEHGSTNNTYFRGGDAFSNRTSFSAANTMQADTIANAAERAGKKVASIDWVGGAAAGIAGPVVDFTNFFSNRGVLVGADNATEHAGSTFFGVDYEVGDDHRTPPAGRTSRPATRRRRRSRRRG